MGDDAELIERCVELASWQRYAVWITTSDASYVSIAQRIWEATRGEPHARRWAYYDLLNYIRRHPEDSERVRRVVGILHRRVMQLVESATFQSRRSGEPVHLPVCPRQVSQMAVYCASSVHERLIEHPGWYVSEPDYGLYGDTRTTWHSAFVLPSGDHIDVEFETAESLKKENRYHIHGERYRTKLIFFHPRLLIDGSHDEVDESYYSAVFERVREGLAIEDDEIDQVPFQSIA